ncbi:hypothetical protein BX616_011157 [Lobosporangium transversale]|nr:hypothetical protein BX616_011157 [Lobosporangium transversale]
MPKVNTTINTGERANPYSRNGQAVRTAAKRVTGASGECSQQGPAPQTMTGAGSSGALEDSILEPKAVGQATVNGDVSAPNSERRAKVLPYRGNTSSICLYHTIIEVARQLRNSGKDIKNLDVLTAPPGSVFPVVGLRHLYIRDEYKELYDLATSRYKTSRTTNHTKPYVVTGMSGIGKSAFLVYFAVRLLAEHDENSPPTIVFQEEKSNGCYVYVGTTGMRYGDPCLFRTVLEQPETWHLLDGGGRPLPSHARTIITPPSRTLKVQYGTMEGHYCPSSYYHMSPWSLRELQDCRDRVKCFHTVKDSLLAELGSKLGGAPRHALQAPSEALCSEPNNVFRAKKRALRVFLGIRGRHQVANGSR